MAKPFHLGALLGEGFAKPEPLRQIGENVEIVARRSHRRDRLMHGEEITVSGSSDVVSFERGRGRQDDVGAARTRGPPDVVDNDGFGALPAAQEPIDILMMVEWIAATPVDELDLGKSDAASVVIDARSRME